MSEVGEQFVGHLNIVVSGVVKGGERVIGHRVGSVFDSGYDAVGLCGSVSSGIFTSFSHEIGRVYRAVVAATTLTAAYSATNVENYSMVAAHIFGRSALAVGAGAGRKLNRVKTAHALVVELG